MRAVNVRIFAVAVTAALAVVVPAAGASAAKPSRGSAPVVSAVGTSNPESECRLGAGKPAVRSTTPTLRATLTDADEQSISATFRVVDSRARVVWAPPATTPQGSGARHAVAVPEGLLTDGGRYAWLVSGRDSTGRWGLPRICQFTVDVTAPTAPDVTPVPGEPAVYLEDATSGGVGLQGSFALTGASSDAVAYRYSFDDSSLLESVPVGSATISYTPTTPGPHTLHVQVVDRAGNVSPVRVYRFTVAWPVPTAGGGTWLLDEGAGFVATGTGDPLTLTPSTTWTTGVLAEFGMNPSDGALLLDGPTDGAVAAGPVVDTTTSLTVAAFVRLDALGTAGTVVSQDGSATSGFALGYDTVGCADGVQACWTFGMASADDTAADRAVARSEVGVQVGDWVQLTGVYDANLGAVSLFVCSIGTAEAPGNANPVAGPPVDLAATWSATGPFRVGQGFGGSSPFTGAVSSVRVVEGVAASVTSVRRSCSQGA